MAHAGGSGAGSGMEGEVALACEGDVKRGQ